MTKLTAFLPFCLFCISLTISATISLTRAAAAQATLYVDADALGPTHDGSSWPDAYVDLQSALTDAALSSGDEIWVAEGTYKPTDTSDRTISFQLVEGVALYGGFAGTETLRNERDWAAHETVLSGDLDGDDDPAYALDDPLRNNAENSYHVVVGASNATLDGFTVTGGHTDSPQSPDGSGAGMLNEGALAVKVANCTFLDNSANVGGGMCNNSSHYSVTACTFSGNAAAVGGGGAANWYSDSSFTACTFLDNSANFEGGGIRNYYSDSRILDSTFSNNAARFGGGMYNQSSSLEVTICTFSGNTADFGGGMYNDESSPAVTSCTFSGNSLRSYNSGAMENRNGAFPSISNCTFTGNSGGIYSTYDSGPVVTNCVLWGNSEVLWYEIDSDTSSSCVVENSDVGQIGGFTDAGGNINADPMFINAETGDLHLQGGSPCIDAANGDTAPAIDIEGYSRYDEPSVPDTGTGTTPYVDMGAHEYQGAAAGTWLNTWSPAAGAVYRPRECLPIRWTVPDGVPKVMVELSRDGGANWEQIAASTPNDGALFWTVTDGGQLLPQLDCVVRVSDALDGNPTGTSGTFLTIGGVWLVDADAPGSQHDGLTWATAFAHPQDAASSAQFGDEIWVAEGTYTPTQEATAGDPRSRTFALAEDVAVYGGFAGTERARDERDWTAHETILSGDFSGDDDPAYALDDPLRMNGENSYHVVTGADDATLNGFTVTGGNADGSYPADCGAGMWKRGGASVTVANCVFSHNRAESCGGAMDLPASGGSENESAVTGCTFAGNQASYGGGLYIAGGSPVVAACVFVGNSGPTRAADCRGGAVRNRTSSPTITDCLFADNSSMFGGAIASMDSASTIARCTFSRNAARDGGAIDSDDSSPTIVGCVFSGNYTFDYYAAHGGGALSSNGPASPLLVNCTLAGNQAEDGGAILSFADLVWVANCVFWQNRASTSPDLWGFVNRVRVSHTVIYQATGFTDAGGNIALDPGFVDPGHWDDAGTPGDQTDDVWIDGDYHLRPGSPCIDRADGDAAPEFDIEGNPRHDDPGMPNAGKGTPDYADIGAYEFQGRSEITPFGGGCLPGGSGAALALGLALALGSRRRRR